MLQREKGDSMDLEVYGGTLVAFSATPLLDPFNTRIQGGDRKNALNASAGSYLGTEIDIGFRWRQFFDSSQLTTGAEFGYLIPGEAPSFQTQDKIKKTYSVDASSLNTGFRSQT